ncbi:hypothetical protein [Lysobacter capsici]|uniref:hypothetical protein n=1 Tax=Lysobacter capsici TaxID=435897 RepID=UPI001C002ACF|nr:hypothetical protein [Lysobacter capsici]QWF17003.1 hypothetical protein KME82_25290 [Lysobacter capsici]
MKSLSRRRCSVLICLVFLSACAFPAREKATTVSESQRQIEQNCALAKERQNQSAIDHWCRAR